MRAEASLAPDNPYLVETQPRDVCQYRVKSSGAHQHLSLCWPFNARSLRHEAEARVIPFRRFGVHSDQAFDRWYYFDPHNFIWVERESGYILPPDLVVEVENYLFQYAELDYLGIRNPCVHFRRNKWRHATMPDENDYVTLAPQPKTTCREIRHDSRETTRKDLHKTGHRTLHIPTQTVNKPVVVPRKHSNVLRAIPRDVTLKDVQRRSVFEDRSRNKTHDVSFTSNACLTVEGRASIDVAGYTEHAPMPHVGGHQEERQETTEIVVARGSEAPTKVDGTRKQVRRPYGAVEIKRNEHSPVSLVQTCPTTRNNYPRRHLVSAPPSSPFPHNGKPSRELEGSKRHLEEEKPCLHSRATVRTSENDEDHRLTKSRRLEADCSETTSCLPRKRDKGGEGDVGRGRRVLRPVDGRCGIINAQIARTLRLSQQGVEGRTPSMTETQTESKIPLSIAQAHHAPVSDALTHLKMCPFPPAKSRRLPSRPFNQSSLS